MTRPNRFLLRMIAFLAVVSVLAALLAPGLIAAFSANPGLNGLIAGVFLIGIVLNFRQVLILKPEGEWLEGWRRGATLFRVHDVGEVVSAFAVVRAIAGR